MLIFCVLRDRGWVICLRSSNPRIASVRFDYLDFMATCLAAAS